MASFWYGTDRDNQDMLHRFDRLLLRNSTLLSDMEDYFTQFGYEPDRGLSPYNRVKHLRQWISNFKSFEELEAERNREDDDDWDEDGPDYWNDEYYGSLADDD